MKREVLVCLSVTAVSFALFIPQFARAKSTDKPNAIQNTVQPIAGRSEAMKMVPAQAVLMKDIDARKAKVGQQIRAKLYKTVHLKDGTDLPSGTRLIGTVAADDLQAGASKLALRFTKAQLKNGKIVPIKATIVGFFPPVSYDSGGDPVSPGDQAANTWSSSTLKIDQLGVLSGVDLHSAIASPNSGSLVSSKRKDVTLQAGSELALAIAEEQHPGQ